MIKANIQDLPKVHRLPTTKARINLGALVKRAHLSGEYLILEKDGIPIAGIMSPDELEDYVERKDPQVQRGIAEAMKISRQAEPAGRQS
ncbi:MAG: type II toxin-antitoxin system Phd/YefM family antitoxin [Acidobacteriota bacterium]|nr:type II toxin-antitoxin system Phd/YefM family antitoxin [Acidobacteriota bacterium]